MEDTNSRKVISLLVDNHSGVLARVSSLFCRRGFKMNFFMADVAGDNLQGTSCWLAA